MKTQTTSSSESSSDSSASDSDDSSIDLQKIALTTFDENICPSDCPEDLYNLAFSLRSKRQEAEDLIREDQKQVEILTREVDHDSKKIKLMEKGLSDCKRSLQDFMYAKQSKLNDIDRTLLMKLHQLQHFVDGGHLAKMNTCVVFDSSRLSELYRRVGELQNEAENQKIMHRKNCTHLHRMNVDCKFMESEIKGLKGDIKEEMMKKFGCRISLVGLYEAVVRRLIQVLKASMVDGEKYDKRVRCLRRKHDEQVRGYRERLR